MEVGKEYEFLGEIEQNNDGSIYLKARLLKENMGMPIDKKVYGLQAQAMSGLVESIFNRNAMKKHKENIEQNAFKKVSVKPEAPEAEYDENPIVTEWKKQNKQLISDMD